MTDVLFYQNYTPVADISTIAICMVLYFLLQSTYTIRQKNFTMFQIANACVTAAAILSITFHEMINGIRADTVTGIYIARDASYILLMLVHVILCEYICNLVDMRGKGRKLFDACVWGFFFFCAAWEITAPVTRLGFWIDSNLGIHQNYYMDIFRMSYIYYTFLMGGLLLRYRRKFITKMFRCMRNVLIVSFLLMVLQATLISTSYLCMTYVLFIIALLFLFHYNAYDAETGTLDVKAFDAYIREMRNPDFTMICLYLHDTNVDHMKKLSEEFFHFSEKYFKDSCTFRLQNDKLAMAYPDKKNRKAEQGLMERLAEFEQLYEQYRVDYRIVAIHSDQRLTSGKDYLALEAFIEDRLPLNHSCLSDKKDIADYLKAAYILSELRDIHAGQDLCDERIKVFCQPVLNTVTNTFTSAEALMRLELAECGMVYPDQFIPLAEQYGYIHTLSKIILNKTCMQLKEMERQGYGLERISVNFSILELRGREFCEDITRIIQDNGVAFDKIAIELTESKNENDFENVKNIMTNLQGLGVKFYLDDFGTGYSSFERIIGLPIDIIKFDRSLTILAGKDEESRYMVGSFSDIFKKSNYQILFEGVENEQDEVQCKKMNALYLQGFKYSKPIPMEQLAEFLQIAG